MLKGYYGTVAQWHQTLTASSSDSIKHRQFSSYDKVQRDKSTLLLSWWLSRISLIYYEYFHSFHHLSYLHLRITLCSQSSVWNLRDVVTALKWSFIGQKSKTCSQKISRVMHRLSVWSTSLEEKTKVIRKFSVKHFVNILNGKFTKFQTSLCPVAQNWVTWLQTGFSTEFIILTTLSAVWSPA